MTCQLSFLRFQKDFFLLCFAYAAFCNEVKGLKRSVNNDNNQSLPIVLWHGMGDTSVGVKYALSPRCPTFEGDEILVENFRFLQDEIPGVLIESLQFGSNPAEDVKNGYFANVNDQIDSACRRLKSLEGFGNGFNAIGLSQGGQFLRGLAQRCPTPQMNNLISLGGQHQGVFGFPHCSAMQSKWCEKLDKFLSYAAYYPWVQDRLVQAQYWHDPLREDDYKTKSTFLADINNEKTQNEDYKTNLQKLNKLVLVKFEQDTMVEPKESEWFGYYKPGSDKEMLTLQQSSLYLEDRIGLKAMEAAQKLDLLSVDGDHLQFTKAWFKDNIIKPYLL